MNRWCRKQRQFIKCFDIHLKTIVLQGYRGTRSQINFASFFLQNAKKLELMTLEVDNRVANCAFFAEQYGVLQMEKRASRTAQLHFRLKRCRRDAHVNHVRDLAITDPFECLYRCWLWHWLLPIPISSGETISLGAYGVSYILLSSNHGLLFLEEMLTVCFKYFFSINNKVQKYAQ